MTGRWCWVKLERRGESWGDGLLKGDLSISVFFTGDEMPAGRARGSRAGRQGYSTPRTPAPPCRAPAPPSPSNPWMRGWEPIVRRGKPRLRAGKGAAQGHTAHGRRSLTPHGPLDDRVRPPPSLLPDISRLRAAPCPPGTPEPWRRPQGGQRIGSKPQSPSGSVLVASQRSLPGGTEPSL